MKANILSSKLNTYLCFSFVLSFGLFMSVTVAQAINYGDSTWGLSSPIALTQ